MSLGHKNGQRGLDYVCSCTGANMNLGDTSILLASICLAASKPVRFSFVFWIHPREAACHQADTHRALCVSHRAKGFPLIISFNPYDNL